jgi:hypothetical protein
MPRCDRRDSGGSTAVRWALTALALGACVGLGLSCRAHPTESEDVEAPVSPPPSSGADGGELEARVALAKTQYDTGERLAMDVYFVNVGKGSQPAAVTVDGRLMLYEHVRIHILDQQGRKVHYPKWNLYAVVPAAQREDFIEIRRGCLYGRAFSRSRGDWEVALERPGTYEVYATLQASEDGSDFGLRAWTGRLESNHVTITVREPSPPREAR